jgi:hypothetical protein
MGAILTPQRKSSWLIAAAALSAVSLTSGCRGSTAAPLKEAERRFEQLYSEGAPLEKLCAAARVGQRIATANKDRAAFHQWSFREGLYC